MKRRLSESDGDGDGAPPTSHNDSDDTSIDSPARQRDNVQETTAIEGPSKVQRVAPDSLAPASPGPPRPSISCSLPPTCSIHPQSFPTHAALSAHYNSHHAHVCQVPSCGKIFPDNHFLDLHLREFHDPLVAVQRENGKKTVSPLCRSAQRIGSDECVILLVRLFRCNVQSQVLNPDETQASPHRRPQIPSRGT